MPHHKRRKARRQRAGCKMCKPWKLNGTDKWAKDMCPASDKRQLQEDSMDFFEGEDLLDSLIEETETEEVVINTCVCSECGGTFELEGDAGALTCPLCDIPFDGKGS